jgi:EAL domain-containing protein (putative c-di-GMP-specific phosphodiesterase class I)
LRWGTAVDEFGTGSSSLNRLKRLPIDALKIDRSFIDGLPTDPHDQSITKAIVALGRTLGLTIVAEGVETVEQWIALDEIGCQFGGLLLERAGAGRRPRGPPPARHPHATGAD